MGPALHSHCRFQDGDPYAIHARCHASPVFFKICISSVYFSKVNFSKVCYLNVYISKVIITTTMRNAIRLMCFSKCIFQRVFKKKILHRYHTNVRAMQCVSGVFSKCIFSKCIFKRFSSPKFIFAIHHRTVQWNTQKVYFSQSFFPK